MASIFTNNDWLDALWLAYTNADTKLSKTMEELRKKHGLGDAWTHLQRPYQLATLVTATMHDHLVNSELTPGNFDIPAADLDHWAVFELSDYQHMLPQFQRDVPDGENLAVLWCAPATSFRSTKPQEKSRWEEVYESQKTVKDVFLRGLTISYTLNDSLSDFFDPSTQQPAVHNLYRNYLQLATGMQVGDVFDEAQIFEHLLIKWTKQVQTSLEPFGHALKIVLAVCFNSANGRYCIRALDTPHLFTKTELRYIQADATYGVPQSIDNCFGKDDTKVVSGSSDNLLCIWNAVTGKWEQTLAGHHGTVNSVEFSPDGTQIVSGSTDTTVRIWNTATGTCEKILAEHSDAVSSVAFSPDGTKVASGSSDHSVRIWDTATGTCEKTLTEHSDAVSSVAFSPNGTQIVSGSKDTTVRIWNTATGTCDQTLTGHTDAVNSVAFSSDGTKVVSGSHDRTVRIWDTATATCDQTLAEHTNAVNSVAFSPDGTQIVSGSTDTTVRIWNTATGTCDQTLEHLSLVLSVSFSLDGTQIVSGSFDKKLRIWNAATGEHEKTFAEEHSGAVISASFSPHGTIQIAWIPYLTERAMLDFPPDAREELRKQYAQKVEHSLLAANNLIGEWNNTMFGEAQEQRRAQQHRANLQRTVNEKAGHHAKKTRTQELITKKQTQTVDKLFTARGFYKPQPQPEPEPEPEPQPQPQPEPEPEPEPQPQPQPSAPRPEDVYSKPEPEPEPEPEREPVLIFRKDQSSTAGFTHNVVSASHPHCVDPVHYSRTILWLPVMNTSVSTYLPGIFTKTPLLEGKLNSNLCAAFSEESSVAVNAKIIDAVRYALKFQRKGIRDKAIDAWVDSTHTETIFNLATYHNPKRKRPSEYRLSFSDANLEFYKTINTATENTSPDPRWVLACNCKQNELFSAPLFISNGTLQQVIDKPELKAQRAIALKDYIREKLMYDVDTCKGTGRDGGVRTASPALLSCAIASAYLHELPHIALALQRYAITRVSVQNLGILTRSTQTLHQYAMNLCGLG